MSFIDFINRATDFILHFDFAKFFAGTKGAVIIFAIIAFLVILFGAFFSLIPQFQLKR